MYDGHTIYATHIQKITILNDHYVSLSPSWVTVYRFYFGALQWKRQAFHIVYVLA